MAYQQILAVANRNSASGQSPAVAVPAGLSQFTVRVDLATPNTFTDPVNEHLALNAQFSTDGGVTWFDAGGGVLDGSATNTWGKGSANPYVGGAIPQNPYPTHARGNYVQTGHYSFGLSIEVV